jgi:hypothetical protein
MVHLTSAIVTFLGTMAGAGGAAIAIGWIMANWGGLIHRFLPLPPPLPADPVVEHVAAVKHSLKRWQEAAASASEGASDAASD